MPSDKIASYITEKEISQGSIFKNLLIPFFNEKLQIKRQKHNVVILSQACDINSILKTKKEKFDNENNPIISNFLPNILFTFLFNTQELRIGIHLKELDLRENFKIVQNVISKKDQTPWQQIIKNKNERYHFLKDIPEIGDSVIDFKHYYTAPLELFLNEYKECYLTSLNVPFREKLSQRFCNYLGRIGLPEL